VSVGLVCHKSRFLLTLQRIPELRRRVTLHLRTRVNRDLLIMPKETYLHVSKETSARALYYRKATEKHTPAPCPPRPHILGHELEESYSCASGDAHVHVRVHSDDAHLRAALWVHAQQIPGICVCVMYMYVFTHTHITTYMQKRPTYTTRKKYLLYIYIYIYIYIYMYIYIYIYINCRVV